MYIKITASDFKKVTLSIFFCLIVIPPLLIFGRFAAAGGEAPVGRADVKPARKASDEIFIVKKETGVSDSGGYEINLTPAAEAADKTNEIWLRLKSRFKTSEIELERKKFGRILPAAQSLEVSVSAPQGVTGEVVTGSGEINLSRAGVPAAPEVLPSEAKTAEVKIESGENLFYRHCYSCHADHLRLKTARVLAGKDFWTKYKPDVEELNVEGQDGILAVIRSGRRTASGDMPSYDAQRLSEKEAAAVIQYLKSMVQPLNIDDK